MVVPVEPNIEGAPREEPKAEGAGAPKIGAVEGAGAPNKPVLPAVVVAVVAEPNPVEEEPKAEVVGAFDDTPNAELPNVDAGVEDTPNPTGAGDPNNPPVVGAGAEEPNSPPPVGCAEATPNKLVDSAGAATELPNPPNTGAGVAEDAGLPNKLVVFVEDPNAEVGCAVVAGAPKPPKDGAGADGAPKPPKDGAAAGGEPKGDEAA